MDIVEIGVGHNTLKGDDNPRVDLFYIRIRYGGNKSFYYKFYLDANLIFNCVKKDSLEYFKHMSPESPIFGAEHVNDVIKDILKRVVTYIIVTESVSKAIHSGVNLTPHQSAIITPGDSIILTAFFYKLKELCTPKKLITTGNLNTTS